MSPPFTPDDDFKFVNPALHDGKGAYKEPLQQTVVILGPGGVGKTSLTIKLITNNFLDYYDPTIEDCYKVQQTIDGQRVYLEILDTAGQEEYSPMQDCWILENEAFVLVYAVDDSTTLEEVEHLKTKIERCNDIDGKKRTIVLVGNKCDCSANRQVTWDDGQSLAEKWGCRFMEASAKDMINVFECFHEAVRAITKVKSQSKVEERPPRRKQCCVVM